MTYNTKALRGKSSADTTTLLNEVNADFAKRMNKIIFDKHCSDKQNNLITGKLDLPPAPEVKQTPYFGMIKIPPPNSSEDDFKSNLTKIATKSLSSYSEVILAQ